MKTREMKTSVSCALSLCCFSWFMAITKYSSKIKASVYRKILSNMNFSSQMIQQTKGRSDTIFWFNRRKTFQMNSDVLFGFKGPGIKFGYEKASFVRPIS